MNSTVMYNVYHIKCENSSLPISWHQRTKNRAHNHHMVVKVYVHISFELNKISLSFYPELLLQKESSLMIAHSVSYNPGIV